MIRFGSGTYNVRASEGINPNSVTSKSAGQNLVCIVYFLDDTERQFEFHRNALGEELLDKVYDHLELIEKDFFGLQFICVLDSSNSGTRMRWLDAKKSIKRQMICPPYHLFFRVKFYVSDPGKLIEEYTRYHVYLQIRKDLVEGRLPCPEEVASILGSYAVQSEYGDYSPEEHDENYLNDFRIVPIQSPSLTRRISELHRLHRGQTPAEAEFNFLDHAKKLELYGFDVYEAKDGNDSAIMVGVNWSGISVFQNGVKMNSFPWSAIIKLSFKRKQFFIEMKTLNDKNEQVDTILVFNAISALNCKILWKSCIEHHTFFRLIAPPTMPTKSLFNLGSRFRYSGRTEYQTMEEMRRRARVERVFKRCNRQSSVGSTRQRSSSSGIATLPPLLQQQLTLGQNFMDDPSSSSFSATSQISSSTTTSNSDFASRLSRRCRRLLPTRRGDTTTRNFFPQQFIRRRMLGECSTASSTSAVSISSLIQSLINVSNMKAFRFKKSYDVKKSVDEIEVDVDLDESSTLEEDSESAAPSTSTPSPRRSQNQTGSTSLTSSAVSTVIQSHPGHSNQTPQGDLQRLSTSTTTPNPIRLRSNSHHHQDTPDSSHSNGTVRSTLTSHRSSINGQNSPWLQQHSGPGTPIFTHPSYAPHQSYPVGPHSPSPYDTTSIVSVPAATPVSHHQEDPKIWHSSNHATNMIINDSAQACISAIPHHQFDKLSTPPNGYRKSLVLNGSPSPYSTTPNNNGSITDRSHLASTQKNGYYNGHGMTNGSASGPTTEFPPATNGGVMNGTTSRRALVNGMNGMNGAMSQSAREPVYKASPRIVQPVVTGKLNGRDHQNGSPRSSIASYTSYTSANGAPNGDYTNGSPKRKSPTRQQSASPTSITTEDSIVQVRMTPDGQGRYGFNVSGGYDRGHPVIVSRVIAGSPADRCHPRLNEGDQVLKINGQDISTWNYDRVVNYIRSVRTNSILGEIMLLIKPNVYRWGELEDSDSNSTQASIPETPHVKETIPHSERLAQSLVLLKDAIETGKVLRQFEQLYRKKPGMTMNDSRTPNNLNKNRYRDVCPYDATRVHLEKAPTGDYINASHVNMEIPSSGIVNRYIATQGPLANTTGDFWYMVWEQSCTTIVMLTTLVEKGRVKCHQYWPSRKETQEFGQLQISMINERSEPHCQYREFSLKNKLTREERRVTQMQYTAWPDHGVPENPKHFIDFVGEVRRARNGSLDPLIVHCSAGIGRTGVLILMETAACLIEANEPVYPLDIVRTMRDQRAMLIQTPDQYVFVNESILRAYNEGSIRPLAEYQKCR